MSYYDRQPRTTIGGLEVFETPEDMKIQRETADVLEKVWKCEIHRFYGQFNPIDYYAVRDGKVVVAFLEIKGRHHLMDKYPSVYLNVRKYMGLMMGMVAMGVPSFFVPSFSDGTIYYVPIGMVPVGPKYLKMGGTTERVKSSTDQEPVFCVPNNVFRKINMQAEPPEDPIGQ